MTEKKRLKKINDTLDFLLEDHQVDFDDSGMDLESLETFHEKADALLVAHQCAIPEGEHDIAGLQPKLDRLIAGHGASFDDSDLDSNSLDTVEKKLHLLVHEHGD